MTSMSAKKGKLRHARSEAQLYRTLAAVNHAVMRADTADQLYAGLCRAIVKEGGFVLSWIGAPDASGEIRVFHIEGSEKAKRHIGGAVISVDAARPHGRGPTGFAWREGRPHVFNDLMAEPRAAVWRDLATAAGLKSVLAMPIRPHRKNAAVLSFYSDEPGFFTPEIVELAQHIAREAEYALENLVLSERVDAMGEALYESRSRLSRIISTLPTPCFVFDVAEKKMVFPAPAIAASGMNRSDAPLRLGINSEIHPEDLAANRPEERHREMRDGEIWEWQARFRVPGGPWRLFRLRETVFERDADGRVRLVLGSLEDVSEHAAQTAEKRRIRRAVEASAESVVITDLNGIIEYVNPAFCRLTGYSREETIGQHTRVLKSGRHDSEFYRALWDTISSGCVWSGRLVNKRKDGTLFEEEATISPVLDEQGKIVNFVAVKRDVSKEVELEKQLLQTQKLEAVGRLAGGVAHDFNNILTAILGSAEILLSQLPPDSPLRSDVEEIQNGGRRAADLTSQLLIFSRRSVSSPRLLDPARVLVDFEKMLRRILGENYELTFVHATRGTQIRIDPVQLEQVVMNLVVNARDAIASRGRIEVAVKDAALQAQLDGAEGPVPPGSYVVLSVSDNGSGIPPEILPRIFEPFFTTKPAGVGTGLGLSTVYGIAKQTGAHLVVDSAPGRGTTMSVYWPAAKGAAPEADDAPPPARGGTERILVVEDEAAVGRLVQRELTLAGYRVVGARSAAEALPLAAAQEFDLLLTDVVLSGGANGKELAGDVRRARPGIKILYMSGYSGDIIASSGALEPGARLLPKPFTQGDLRRAVRDALDAPR